MFIHKIAEIAPQDLFTRGSEKPTEGVVEVEKAALQIGFVKSVGDVFEKRAVALLQYLFVRMLLHLFPFRGYRT